MEIYDEIEIFLWYDTFINEDIMLYIFKLVNHKLEIY